MPTAKAILDLKAVNDVKCPYCGGKLTVDIDTPYTKVFYCLKEEIRIIIEG